MIRPGYRLNDADNMLLQIFPDPHNPDQQRLTGFRPMGPGRAIDWGRFIDLDTRPYGVERRRHQSATTRSGCSSPIASTPRWSTRCASCRRRSPPIRASLALRNLERGWRLGLPSGQAVAKAMDLTPLTRRRRSSSARPSTSPARCDPQVQIADHRERRVRAATARSGPTSWPRRGKSRPTVHDPGHRRAGRRINTPQLGPVGGRIVAEVFLGMMFGDDSSVLSLDPQWTPVTGPDFRLKDLVTYALGGGDPLH